MKKRIIFLLIGFCISYVSYAQRFDNSIDYGKVGAAFSSFGNNDLIYFKNMDEGPDFEGVKFYAFDVFYLYSINHFLTLESGIGMSFHQILVTPDLPPNIEVKKFEENITLVNIPLNVRMQFLYNFFITGGGFINLDFDDFTSIHKQTGLGANFGVGYQYDFEIGISVFLSPYAKVSTLLPVKSKVNYQRLVEYGLRFGVAYRI